MVGLFFAASWCPACRSTTPALASAYKALRARGHKLQIVFVSQDAEPADFDAHRTAMPWPALPHGGTLPALLAEIFHVASTPCLVLLNGDGALISTDGVRLLRKHARAFPWSSATPPETPHIHPLCERLMRREPVDAGTAHELPHYTPVDMLQQPSIVRTLDEAVAAIANALRDYATQRPALYAATVRAPEHGEERRASDQAVAVVLSVLDGYGLTGPEAIHAARQGSPGAADDLIRLIDDADVPGIVRGTAVTLLRSYPGTRSVEAARRAAAPPRPTVSRDRSATT